MRCILIVLGILAPSILAQAPDMPVIKNPTHVLQLMPAQSDKPIDIQVRLFQKGNKKLMANIMPDGQRMESEYVITQSKALKFQWAAIKRDGLLAIQFIGDRGTTGGSFSGKYVALVDGELRKDMSGQFKLTATKTGR